MMKRYEVDKNLIQKVGHRFLEERVWDYGKERGGDKKQGETFPSEIKKRNISIWLRDFNFLSSSPGNWKTQPPTLTLFT